MWSLDIGSAPLFLTTHLQRMVDSSPMIELVGLERSFGSTRAVNDVSFEVSRGQVFGYIGPNGAGKTTSMRILATLDRADGGRRVCRRLFRGRRSRPRAPPAGVHARLFRHVSERERASSISISSPARTGWAGESGISAIGDVMEFTQLDTLADKPIDGLSKGMKQRLCLGRTMIHDPAVLILDEPAAGLDPRARIELREMISRLADARQKRFSISSHILTELAEMCDAWGSSSKGEYWRSARSTKYSGGSRNSRASSACAYSTARRGWPGGLSRGRTCAMCGPTVTRSPWLMAATPSRKPALLYDMVQAGFRVVAFGSQPRSLEEVFMQVTKGKVQ